MDCTEQNLRMPENATQISTEEAVRLHRLKSFHTLRLGRIESWGAHGPEPLDGTDWVIVGYGGRGYLVIDRLSSESLSKEIQSLSDYQREHAGAEKAADLVFEEGPDRVNEAFDEMEDRLKYLQERIDYTDKDLKDLKESSQNRWTALEERTQALRRDLKTLDSGYKHDAITLHDRTHGLEDQLFALGKLAENFEERMRRMEAKTEVQND